MAEIADLALVRFAARHGLDLDLLRGQPFPGKAQYREHRDPYSVRMSSSQVADDYDGTIQAVRIHRLHRFSNSLVQLAQALHAAHHLGAVEVQVPDAWYLKSGRTVIAPNLVLVNGKRHYRRDGAALEGLYFYGYTLAPACPDRPGLRELLLPIRTALKLAINQPPLPADHIVLHVRSGDLFGPDPHPAYFQPPLALYLNALQGQSWAHVHVVFEDYGNPVVQALAAWCAGQDIPLTLHSWGLQRDLSVLLRAHTLVVGRGTFMPGVVALSLHAREVHSYGPFDHGGAWGLHHIHNLIYSDPNNHYVTAVRPWRHTQQQRELMLSFPVDQLEVRSSN